MLTVAVELSKALVARTGGDDFTLLCSRERPPALEALNCEAVLSPYRHEVALKTRWLPTIEPQLESDAILYPFWPSPPFRQHDAPPAAIFVHDLAYRIRPQEVPWQQRVYMRAVLGRALRQAAAVLVPSESTRRDVLEHFKDLDLGSKVMVISEGLPPAVPAGPLPAGFDAGVLPPGGSGPPRQNAPPPRGRGPRHGGATGPPPCLMKAPT